MAKTHRICKQTGFIGCGWGLSTRSRDVQQASMTAGALKLDAQVWQTSSIHSKSRVLSNLAMKSCKQIFWFGYFLTTQLTVKVIIASSHLLNLTQLITTWRGLIYTGKIPLIVQLWLFMFSRAVRGLGLRIYGVAPTLNGHRSSTVQSLLAVGRWNPL